MLLAHSGQQIGNIKTMIAHDEDTMRHIISGECERDYSEAVRGQVDMYREANH